METEQTLRRSERKIKRSEESWPEVRDVPMSKQWSRTEKAQLLKALQAFEETDIASISASIPTKTPQQVDYFIRNMKIKASAVFSNKVPLISELEKWAKMLKRGKKNKDLADYEYLALPLFFISAFENFPHPSNTDGIDFKAAYEFIFCIMAEIPPRPLNKKTMDFISQTFFEMGAMISENSDLKEYVKNSLIDSSSDSPSNNESVISNPLNFPEIVLPLFKSSIH